MIYLDAAATTPVSDAVLNAMLPYFANAYGNPNSIHSFGIEAREALEKAREQVANAINANPTQIIFTSGGSEANNLAIHGFRRAVGDVDYVSSHTEHTSSLMALKAESQRRANVRYTEDDGEEFEVYWTTLFWKMYVNNEIGEVSPIYDIGEVLNGDNNIYFGTDCVQALGFEKIDVKEMKCDFATFSAHKIHGPKGVGAIYVKDQSLIKPIIDGGVSQERGIRGGTENIAGIVGFGKACEIAETNRQENRNRILYLRNMFLEKIDGIEYKLNCEDESKILSIQLPGIDSETLVLALSSMGDIAISAGSACRNKESEPNEALLACGLSEEEARSTVRVSFMESLTEKEVVMAAEKFKGIVRILKKEI